MRLFLGTGFGHRLLEHRLPIDRPVRESFVQHGQGVAVCPNGKTVEFVPFLAFFDTQPDQDDARVFFGNAFELNDRPEFACFLGIERIGGWELRDLKRQHGFGNVADNAILDIGGIADLCAGIVACLHDAAYFQIGCGDRRHP